MRNNEVLITMAQLLGRGWTGTLIEEFLPLPDQTAPYPECRHSGSPMKLYLLKRVERKERSIKFRKAKESADLRTIASQKAVASEVTNVNQIVPESMVTEPGAEKGLSAKVKQQEKRISDLRRSLSKLVTKQMQLRHDLDDLKKVVSLKIPAFMLQLLKGIQQRDADLWQKLVDFTNEAGDAGCNVTKLCEALSKKPREVFLGLSQSLATFMQEGEVRRLQLAVRTQEDKQTTQEAELDFYREDINFDCLTEEVDL